MVLYKRGDSIYIKAEYSASESIKSKIKGSRWDVKERAWVAPATLATFYNLVDYDKEALNPATLSPEIREWSNTMVYLARRLDALQRGDGEEPVFPDWFTFTCTPYKHQKEALAFAVNVPRSAMWLDLGLGKTYIAIHAARYRNKVNDVVKVLVLAPLSVAKQWPEEIRKYGEDAECVVITGTPERKIKMLTQVRDTNHLTFAIMTYESVAALHNNIISVGFDMIIMDESTKIKNPKAKRTQAVIDIATGIPYAIELTGLAYLNNPTDLFSQFSALDQTVFGTKVYSFMDRYIDFVKMPFGKVMRGIKRIQELKQRAYYVAFSRNKSECLDLPEKTYLTRRVPLTDEQEKYYNAISEELLSMDLSELGGSITINGVLPQLEKLQQITSGFLMGDDSTLIELDCLKYEEMVDIIEASKENFIVWCRHRYAMAKAMEVLKNAGIPAAELSRHVKDDARKKSIEDFRRGDGSVRVLVCSLASESRGLNLVSEIPVNSIYLENSMSIDERWQSESRQHRIGMTGTATYIDIVADETIDEEIVKLLNNKYNISEYISKFGLDTMVGSYTGVKKLRKKPRAEINTSNWGLTECISSAMS